MKNENIIAIKKARQRLSNQVLYSISEFQVLTGLTVERINLSHIDRIGLEGHFKECNSVEIDARLG